MILTQFGVEMTDFKPFLKFLKSFDIRPNIDEYYMMLAMTGATRAGCPKRNVCAIITNKRNRVLSIGYNSPPRNLPTCHDVPCGGETPEHPCIAAHAEISAITSCADLDAAHNIYISCSPCLECTKAVMNTNIQRIIFGEYHKTWPHAKSIWTGETTYMEQFDETI